MKKSALAYLAAMASVSFLLGAQSVSAASTDELRAKAYFNAIAGGNADTIASFYAEQAEFHWVGGPLAGIYKGKTQIKNVWQKFGEAAGDMKHQVLEISESQNGRISTVTARVKFIGPKEVPVKFILMYENGKITNEIWQVDKPEPATYAKAEPDSADTAAAAAAATAAAKIAATQPPVEQPAETALPPVDKTASEKPREIIATITTSPPPGSPSRAAAPDDRQDRVTPPVEGERDAALDGPPAPEKRTAGYLPPEKPTAEKKAVSPSAPDKKVGEAPPQKKFAAKKPQKPNAGRDYYDDDEDDYYEEYRPRRYYGYYGYRPYRPYYGYGLGYRLGYGSRYYGRGGY